MPREVVAVDPGSWDRVAIIAALWDWAGVVGRAPRAYEWHSAGPGRGAKRWRAEHPRWPSAGTVVYHFGSWSGGLRVAGLPALGVEHELPRRERVATAVALRAAGETIASIAEHLGVHVRTVHRYLAATPCVGCGGPALYGQRCLECTPRAQPAATADEITAALRAWTTEQGEPPRETDWRHDSPTWRQAWPRWPGTTTVLRVFGSWNAALAAAGLPTRRYAWDPEELVDRLAGWARKHGRPPTISEARADPWLPSLRSCQDLCGSWTSALRAAGLTPAYESHWDDKQLRDILVRWARWHTRHGDGEPSAASYARWAKQQPELMPSASSIKRRHGGSWNAARVAAGLPATRAGRPRSTALPPGLTGA